MIKSVYVYVCLMMLAAVSLASCKGDDAYKEENAAYFNEKMAEKGADGELLYKQVEYNGYKALYRIIAEEGYGVVPTDKDTGVNMSLQGMLINGTIFQSDKDLYISFDSLIPGLAQVMYQTSLGQTVEVIIPAELGYGDSGIKSIPGGSTLMFTYKMISYTRDEYKNENAAYFNEKMAEKGADGELLYKQVVYKGYKTLYRVIKKVGNNNTHPQADTRVTMTLKGDLIDGTNFQSEGEYTFTPKTLISGLAQVMLQTSIGETVETIIPAALGYGDGGRGPIPGGSTLIFTYTMLEYK